jgi:hypothetical protein
MWRDAAGDDKFMIAPVQDISESGVGMQIVEPLPLRSFVTLRAGKLGIHGRASVRHCSQQGLKYRIGVEFTGGFRWKPVEEEKELAVSS